MELPEQFKRALEDYTIDQLSHSNEEARDMWRFSVGKIKVGMETPTEAHVTFLRKPSQTTYKNRNVPLDQLPELRAALGALGNLDPVYI